MNLDNKPGSKKGHKYQTRSQKKDIKKKEVAERYKENESSDDDDDASVWESDDDEMDMKEYRKLLSTIFPSKYIRDKANATPSRNKCLKNDDSSEGEQDSTPSRKKPNKNKNERALLSGRHGRNGMGRRGARGLAGADGGQALVRR